MSHQDSNEFDIAVIGMSCRFPDANTIEAYWENLKKGIESVKEIAEPVPDDSSLPKPAFSKPNYLHVGSLLDDVGLFDAEFFGYSPKEAALLDPQQRIFLEVAWEAIEQAGYDPDRYTGSIGVFAGAGFNHYLINNLLKGRHAQNDSDGFFLQISNANDNLATRTAYKLNLKGPCLSIQTACSTSLVSVHYACQSLLNMESDMALAGGVTIRVPQNAGYFHEKELIMSQDGHCCPFSDNATGTVFGSGAGAVLLKRYNEAVAEGDTILALIKGSAVNNDGSGKVGYTAPSAEGQAEVITKALSFAGVPPESITNLEAHGTGTILGDPIEFEALNKVFRTSQQQQKRPLGSVKGNVGHLENAAGIASFIKMVLSLNHRKLLPSINFRQQNPYIDFEQSSFYVNTEFKDWDAYQEYPRRGGVSSFGIGGTNSHVILEEYAGQRKSGDSRPAQLIMLSAKSKRSLQNLSRRIAQYLETHQQVKPADVAWTLRTGRAGFKYRKIVAAKHRNDLIAGLGSDANGLAFSTEKTVRNPDVIFLFPGQGAQYPRMGAEIYENEPVFKKEFDKCAVILKKLMGEDIRELVFPGEDSLDSAAELLKSTVYTQPILFAMEYALAQLWRSWGMAPKGMIGHSIGEYVAACLAGVFDLMDALRVVTQRAKLINEMSKGAMCAVSLSEEELQAVLPETLSIAAVNGPSLTVASGESGAIAAFKEDMESRGVASSVLHTSHAYHSRMMTEARDRFLEVMKTVKLNAPDMPYFSNVTGTLVTEEQAVSPRYWADHITHPVRFSAAVSELLSEEKIVFLEVGPGTTLSRLVKNHRPDLKTVSSLPHPEDDRDADTYIINALGKLWAFGVVVDWSGFDGHENRLRVPLPAYPFDKKRYWIHPLESGTGSLEDVTVDMEENREGDQESNAAAVPTTDEEKTLALFFGKALGICNPGLDADFFELGGHSLLATQLLNSVNQEFSTDIGLKDFFNAATIKGLARLVMDNKGNENNISLDFPELKKDLEHRHQPFPLTEMQQAQWLGRSGVFSMGNVAAHVYIENQKKGIDLERLEQSWQEMIERHEMLRVVFLPEGGQQFLDDPPHYRIKNLDLRNESDTVAEQKLLAVRKEMDHIVRPVDKWPLFEIRTTQLKGDLVRIHFSIDLLICDVASMRILRKEWATRYHNPEAELLELDLSFRDYVVTEKKIKQTPFYQRADQFWSERVKELPAMPLLPVSKQIDAIEKPECLRVATRLESNEWEQLKSFGLKRKISPSIILLTVFSQVLANWSRLPDFCVNTTIINRMPLHPQSEDIVGEFASYAPLEVNVGKDESFERLAGKIQQRNWENLENRYVSGTTILRKIAQLKGGSSGSVMPFVFTSTLVHEVEGEADIIRRFGDEIHFISQTPQVWLDHAVFEDEQGVVLSWHYVNGLFPDGLVETMWDCYCRLLQKLATDETEWVRTYNDLTPTAQIEQRNEINSNRQSFEDLHLHTLFFTNAAKHPDRMAILTETREITYGDLAEMAERIASELVRLDAPTETLVAVVMDKGWEQVAAVLGILKAGCAYLPLSDDLPKERLWYILENSDVHYVLIKQDHHPGLTFPDQVKPIKVSQESIASLPKQPIDREVPAASLAYVIYTSGSTGVPKGVIINHDAAQNTIMDINQRFGIDETDRVLAISELNFDLSVYDVFGLLSAGGAIVMPNPGTARDPEHWLQLTGDHRVTIWNSVPALMDMFVTFASQSEAEIPLRLALLSGDWIPVTLPDRMTHRFPQTEVIGLGGATEASIWSIMYPIAEYDGSINSIPYGKPLTNQSFFVLNPNLGHCPVQVPGDLYIGGKGLAKGYWKRPELNEKAFIYHPESNERLYKTGDVGRYLPDGNIEFLGREDLQVKISGFRIELEDIEAALINHPAIEAAVVDVLDNSHTNKRLVGYLVAKTGREVSLEEVSAFLEDKLPDYMIPGDLVLLDAFPLSANGKINRKAFPKPSSQQEKREAPALPDDDIARKLVETFSDTIGIEVDRIGIDENFFSLGGDSILGIQIITKLNAMGINLSPRELFSYPTVRELSEIIAKQHALDGSGSSGLKKHKGPIPLLPMQTYLLTIYGQSVKQANVSVFVKAPEYLQPELAEAAFQHLSKLYDIMRLIYVEENGTWVQKYADSLVLPEIDYVDVSQMSDQEFSNIAAGIEKELREAQTLAESPLIKLCLFDHKGSASHIMMVANHLITNLQGVHSLLQDFFLIYLNLDQNKVCGLDIDRTSFLEWVGRFHESAGTHRDQNSGDEPKPVSAKKAVSGQQPFGTSTEIKEHRLLSLNAENTQRLLTGVLEKAKLEPEEFCLLALAETLMDQGMIKEALRVDLAHQWQARTPEGDDVGNGSGNFTRLSPLRIEARQNESLTQKIASVKEKVRHAATAQHDFFPDQDVEKSEVAAPFPYHLKFSFLGIFDNANGFEWQAIRPTPADSGIVYDIEIQAYVKNQNLVCNLIQYHDRVANQFVDTLRAAFSGQVARLSNQIENSSEMLLTPLDFPYARIDDAQLTEVLSSLARHK